MKLIAHNGFPPLSNLLFLCVLLCSSGKSVLQVFVEVEMLLWVLRVPGFICLNASMLLMWMLSILDIGNGAQVLQRCNLQLIKKKHSYTVSSYTVGNLYEHLKLGPQEPLACCHGTAHVLLSGLKRCSTRNQHIYRNYLVHRLIKKWLSRIMTKQVWKISSWHSQSSG